MIDTVLAILLIQVDDRLAVAAGIELMPEGGKAASQFLIIVYFAIGHQAYVSTLVEKGLPALIYANDG
jgi:hypothetical protein